MTFTRRSLRLAAIVGLLFASAVCQTSAIEEVKELASSNGEPPARVLLHMSHVSAGCRGGCGIPGCSDTPIPMGTQYEAVLEVDVGNPGPIRAIIPASETWHADAEVILDVEGPERLAVAEILDHDWRIAHLTTNGVFWDRVPRGARVDGRGKEVDWSSVPTLAGGIARIFARAPENERRLLLAELERRGGREGLCAALADTVGAPPAPEPGARAEAPPEIDIDPSEEDAWSRAAEGLDEKGKACLGARLATEIGRDFNDLPTDAAALARHRVAQWAAIDSEGLVPGTLAMLGALEHEGPTTADGWKLLAARVAAAGVHEPAKTRAACCAGLPHVVSADGLGAGRDFFATTCAELLATGEEACPAVAPLLELDPCHPAIGCGKKGARLCKVAELPPVESRDARTIMDLPPSEEEAARLARAALRVALRDEAGLPESFLGRRKRASYRLKQKKYGDNCVFAEEVGTPCTCHDDGIHRAACSVPLEQTSATTEHCAFQIDDKRKRLQDVRSTQIFMSDAPAPARSMN